MPATTEGVEITLDGQPVTLRYTLGASKAICAVFGGFSECFARIFKFDPTAFEVVVAAGLGRTRDAALDQSVFAAGYETLYKDLGEYLSWLSNGGKAPKPVTTDAATPGNV